MQLAKMTNDPKFVELTADVLEIVLWNSAQAFSKAGPFRPLWLPFQRHEPSKVHQGRRTAVQAASR